MQASLPPLAFFRYPAVGPASDRKEKKKKTSENVVINVENFTARLIPATFFLPRRRADKFV